VAFRILCVDDEDDICHLLATILTMCGYDAVTASTGIDALRGAAARPDLVLLDINLPDMDGIEVCRELRRFNPRVPVIFLTAATAARRTEAMAAGGSAFVEKPFDVDELLETIERLLASPTDRRSGRDRRERFRGSFRGTDRREGDRRLWQGQSHVHASAHHAANTAVRHPQPNGHGHPSQQAYALHPEPGHGRPGAERERHSAPALRARESREA
jgi:DNA-binding response OmpR family regulator